MNGLSRAEPLRTLQSLRRRPIAPLSCQRRRLHYTAPSKHGSAAGTRSPRRVLDSDIAALAKLPQHPLSLDDLVKHGRPPLSEEALLASANFTLSLLPIRLAHRLQALRNLPFIVVSNPNISKIHDNYVRSLSTLLPWWRGQDDAKATSSDGAGALNHHPITTLEDEIHFSNVLKDLVETHAETIPILAQGFLEARRYIAPADVTRFLEEHLRARIGTRMVAEQHLALHASSQPHAEGHAAGAPEEDVEADGRYIGVIDTALRPASIIHSRAAFVGEMCEFRYGVRPRLVIDGDVETRFAYMPMHLEYIITELLKNAFRATAENRSTEPVVVTIAAHPPAAATGDDDGLNGDARELGSAASDMAPKPIRLSKAGDAAPGVTIRIRDRGGGIAPDVLPNVWSYSFTTFSEFDPDEEDGLDSLNLISATSAATASGGSLAGLGYGLPLSRAYAEYFGGGIALQSLFGWGTDVYLRLKGVGRF